MEGAASSSGAGSSAAPSAEGKKRKQEEMAEEEFVPDGNDRDDEDTLAEEEALDQGDVKEELSKLDEELLAKLSAGDIRLVRSAWLLLPAVTKMRKRQELETIEEQGATRDVSPLPSCDEAAALVRRGTRSAAVLSHGWLLGGDCDPQAERLALVKQALAEYPHIEGLFWE